MRYAGWARWRTDGKAVPERYRDAGRKLLGALQNRLKLGGTSTGADHATLDDGTRVDVAWINGQPMVKITPVGSLQEDEVRPVCELYVESGLLDLGPDISATATARFDKQRPAFNDAPATLYAGADMDCTTLGGLNGRIDVGMGNRRGALRSQCVADAGASAESHLTKPARKQAQAVLAASCWTGYMHRYVAALYGGNRVGYRLGSTNTLEVRGVSISPWAGNSWGLLRFGDKLWFVRITADAVHFHAVVTDDCGQAVLTFWRGMPEGDDEEKTKKARVLSVFLSCCAPSPEAAYTRALSLPGALVGTYGWAFTESTPRAIAVVKNETNASLVELVFSYDDEPDVSMSVLESSAMPKGKAAAQLVSPSTSDMAPTRRRLSGDTPLAPGAAYDHPVSAHYDKLVRVVTRFKLTVQGIDSFEMNEACQPYGAISAVQHDLQNCTGAPGFDWVNMNAGLYRVRDATPEWTMVAMGRALVLRDDPDTLLDKIDEYTFVTSERLGGPVAVSRPATGPFIPGSGQELDDCEIESFFREECPTEYWSFVGYRDWASATPEPRPATFFGPGNVNCSPDEIDHAEPGGTIHYNRYEFRDSGFRGEVKTGIQSTLAESFGSRTQPVALRYSLDGAEGGFLQTHYWNDFEDYTEGDVVFRQQCFEPLGVTYQTSHIVSQSQDACRPAGILFPGGGSVWGNQLTPDGPVFTVSPHDMVTGTEQFGCVTDSGADMGTSQFFRYHPDGTTPPLSFATTNDSQCSDVYANIFGAGSISDPLTMETEPGPRRMAERFSNSDDLFSEDFQFRAQRAIGAGRFIRDVHAPAGWSVDNDRELLSGGYSALAGWPSFVGWA